MRALRSGAWGLSPMKLGVVNEESWAFFGPVYDELAKHHQTELFRRQTIASPVLSHRLNRRRLNRDLGRLLRSNSVVFFEWASELLAKATHMPKSCGIVTRLHRYEMYQWADRIKWDAVDRVILVSEAKRREFLNRFPDQECKIVVIPEAVDLEQLEVEERPFSGDLGTLCHLSPRKRVYELILAFSQLDQARGPFRLHIGGRQHPRFPDYEFALHDLVARLGLSEKVKFYGHVEDPSAWYRNIDIFISNSYSEGLQVSPMEAIASGRYCLSHKWDGADELLDGDHLFITDQELITRIHFYADQSPAKRAEIRRLQHQRVVQNFNIKDTKRHIRAIVEDVGRERANAS